MWPTGLNKDKAKTEPKTSYTPEEARQLEDKMLQLVDGDDKTPALLDEEQATLYTILNGRGMTLETARRIRRKMKLTGA